MEARRYRLCLLFGGAGCDENSAARRIRLSKCLICAALSGSFVVGSEPDASREERYLEVNCEPANHHRRDSQ
jgi:hypothetical protein